MAFPKDLVHEAEALLETCRRAGLRLVTAESCTGGLIAACLTEIAGSSDVVERGFVTYSNEAKSESLGVPAALIAKHRLKDLPLARRYASAIQRHATDPTIPLWARQMEVFILEDMNELEAARVMLGGLLATGRIQDPGERRFLEERLKALDQRIRGRSATAPGG